MSDIEKIGKIRTGGTANLPGSPFLKTLIDLSTRASALLNVKLE